MRSLILSADTLAMIARHAEQGRGFRTAATPRADGMFNVPFSDDTIERINESRLPGDTDDAVIVRILERFESGGVQ